MSWMIRTCKTPDKLHNPNFRDRQAGGQEQRIATSSNGFDSSRSRGSLTGRNQMAYAAFRSVNWDLPTKSYAEQRLVSVVIFLSQYKKNNGPAINQEWGFGTLIQKACSRKGNDAARSCFCASVAGVGKWAVIWSGRPASWRVLFSSHREQ
eukprot:1029375-Rhodomonas_salina.2